MTPGIEITWLPTVVPAGHGKNEIAVPEGTSVGSQGFQSLATPAASSTTLGHPLRDVSMRADSLNLSFQLGFGQGREGAVKNRLAQIRNAIQPSQPRTITAITTGRFHSS